MRPSKARVIDYLPPCRCFIPVAQKGEGEETLEVPSEDTVIIGLDMLEAMRLVDGEKMSQEEAAQKMNVSTPTLCRILGQGRSLVTRALIFGKCIRIEGGNIMYGCAMQGHHGIHNGRGMQRKAGRCMASAAAQGRGMGPGHGMGPGRGRFEGGEQRSKGECRAEAKTCVVSEEGGSVSARESLQKEEE
ncbi:MAG: DUF134 domain-containing protein [Desulfovibrio sp.]|nr:DUF134 domain-containing protein [Desulfovibrio sp.]